MNNVNNPNKKDRTISCYHAFLKNQMSDGNYKYSFRNIHSIGTDSLIINQIRDKYQGNYVFLNFHLIPKFVIEKIRNNLSKCITKSNTNFMNTLTENPGSKKLTIDLKLLVNKFFEICKQHEVPIYECHAEILNTLTNGLESKEKRELFHVLFLEVLRYLKHEVPRGPCIVYEA